MPCSSFMQTLGYYRRLIIDIRRSYYMRAVTAQTVFRESLFMKVKYNWNRFIGKNDLRGLRVGVVSDRCM